MQVRLGGVETGGGRGVTAARPGRRRLVKDESRGACDSCGQLEVGTRGWVGEKTAEARGDPRRSR
jgi:hypothetical protein